MVLYIIISLSAWYVWFILCLNSANGIKGSIHLTIRERIIADNLWFDVNEECQMSFTHFISGGSAGVELSQLCAVIPGSILRLACARYGDPRTLRAAGPCHYDLENHTRSHR